MIRLIASLLLFLFGIVVSFYSYVTYADFSDYGAAFYPTLIGVVVACFALLDFAMEIKIKGKQPLQNLYRRQEAKSILLIVGVVFFYLLCADYLGFILTTSVILIAITLPLLKTGKILTALLLIALSIGIYYLFARVLLVSLPSGVLFE